LSAEKRDALWQQVVEAVGRVSPFTRTYLLQAHLVSFEKRIFVIGFEPQFADHIELVDNSKNRTMILTKLKELSQDAIQVKFIKADAPAQADSTARSAAPAAKPASAPKPVTDSAVATAKKTPPSPIAAPSAKASKPAQEPVLTKEDFQNDPLIKQALEIFKGQIVEIRA
jgi:DNA polymerase-3 subunit gamma/tau